MEYDNTASVGSAWLCGLMLALGFASPSTLLADEIKRNLSIEFSSPLLASRGDAELSHLELDARIQKIPERDRADVVHGPARLQQLIEDQLQVRAFADRAIDNGILDEELVRAELYLMISTWLSERYRDQVIEREALDDYTDQAREIYLLNPERFQTVLKVTFSHILIANDPDSRARSAELLDQIQNGAEFEALAREHSEDPSVANNGGRFDRIELERLDAGFRDGISELEVGVPGLVQSSYGWHVVDVQARLPAGTQPFEEVADELREQARTHHAQQIVDRLLRAYYAQELEIAEGAVAEVLDRYPFD